VVIDPIILAKEIEALEKMGVDINAQLLISRKAHIILPTHCALDAASEAEKGKEKIGSTLKGIGPTYMDKTGRNGMRVGDLFLDDFKERYDSLTAKHERILSHYKLQIDISEKEELWFKGIDKIKSLTIIDSEHYINSQLRAGDKILAEGAQGSLLDIDFGSYPFVTSSNTISAGACTGLGIAPNKMGEVIGIFKAYCTRVGSGPFPTELHDKVGEKMRKEGNEFGATTGRPRRCGWIDLPALKYTIMINGVTQLNMTKADVLSVFDEILVCTHYEVNGNVIDYLPFDISDGQLKPIYKALPGWKTDLTQLKDEDDFPSELSNYISYLEAELETPITIVSVGPDRAQTILRKQVVA